MPPTDHASSALLLKNRSLRFAEREEIALEWARVISVCVNDGRGSAIAFPGRSFSAQTDAAAIFAEVGSYPSPSGENGKQVALARRRWFSAARIRD